MVDPKEAIKEAEQKRPFRPFKNEEQRYSWTKGYEDALKEVKFRLGLIDNRGNDIG